MNLVKLSLNRPVFAWMMSLLIVVFGWMSFERIGLDRYPSVEFPMVSVSTVMLGANPEIIDSSITRVIESQVNAIPGVEHIQSKSSPGISQVYLTFRLEKDIDVAFNEVQAKVNQVLNQLPDDIKTPQVAKVEAGGAPVIWLTLEGNRTLQQLNAIATNQIKRYLENIDGVGQVVLGGEQKHTIRIDLDIDRLNAYGLSVLEVMSAIEHEHFQLPGGFLTHGEQEYLIKLDAEFHQIETLKTLPIAQRGNTIVQLQDVAKVVSGLADKRKLARFQGSPTVGIGLIKVSGSNTVDIVNEAKIRLERDILPNLEPGVTLRIASDDASFIQLILESMKEHLWLGTLLTAIVMWLFLKNIRATAIISLSIPVSLLGAVAVMYFAGFTFNTMTLLALLLLIGIVVDDAIVVLENIHRVAETEGISMRDAALKGTQQVQFAVIAASLTLVSIFMAVIFMEGIIGRFFKEFGVVVTIGILVSLWVSLTLIPVLSARYLRVDKSDSKRFVWLDNAFISIERTYQAWLFKALENRRKTLQWTAGIVGLCFLLATQLGSSFMPKQDQGQFIVNFKAPLGSSLAYTEKRLEDLETVLQNTPGVAAVFSSIGTGQTSQVNEGRIVVRLDEFSERDIHMTEIMQSLSQQLNTLAGVKSFVSPLPMMSGQRGEPFRFVIQGPDLQQVSVLSETLLKRLQKHPELGELDLDLQMALPQVNFEVNRQKAALLGLSSESVAQAINVLAGGVQLAKYSERNQVADRYDVQLKAIDGQLNQVKDLSKIFIKSKTGQLVSLDTVATMVKQPAAAVVPRYDLAYASMFFSAPTVSLSKAIKILNSETEGLLPGGYQIKMTGQAEELKKTSHYMLVGLLLSLLLVYMVLASQFNAFVQPLIIMLAQPLAIAGGILALWLTGLTLNIFSMIGLVLLMGLVAKNAILLVDLTNQFVAEGQDAVTALKQACPIRLRPVLMTSLTVIFTMLPAAMGFGAGSDANAPLAVAVIGGMISSTVLTLIVVPVAYSYLAEYNEKIPLVQQKAETQAKLWWVLGRAELNQQVEKHEYIYRPLWKNLQQALMVAWHKLEFKRRLYIFWYGDESYRKAYLDSIARNKRN
ncbi:multidrug transporter [Thiomicrorhabdus immobilis]|uniref:Multidrug transporter n=1 Tax=Thiomicrorhabdus immobilis TaxID=2791037 RepID=A0ABN6D082_9GAMM|nr:efflux RND transporter permease subunit [Thiomicrorhabdus immobilis]BCN94334.1 multidrug transporter [Thiomicrorhabdus immobilis]